MLWHCWIVLFYSCIVLISITVLYTMSADMWNTNSLSLWLNHNNTTQYNIRLNKKYPAVAAALDYIDKLIMIQVGLLDWGRTSVRMPRDKSIQKHWKLLKLIDYASFNACLNYLCSATFMVLYLLYIYIYI